VQHPTLNGQNKDAWMVGYTPQLSTAVWVGTSDGTALTNYNGASIYGSGLPSSIWKSAMDAALEGKEIKQFPEPESVGGVAGVPYEAPVTTEAPTRTRGPSVPTFDIPDQGGDGNLTLAPGVTIPIPGAPRNGGGGGGGNSPGGGGLAPGDGGDGGGDSGDGVPGGGDGGGGVPEPPIG
jgi:membrane peptidoglycan carboxypeptidase